MATRAVRSVASSATLVPASRKAAAGPVARFAAAPPHYQLMAARAGDHPSIHGFLMSVFQGPTAAEFHAQLEEPGYLPADRLVVKQGDEIMAHMRLARQTIQAGSNGVPSARFMDLATAPQLRGRGVATALVSAGERAAGQRGALVGLTRTRVPSLFARQGWSVCGGQACSEASPRAVLAEIAAQRLTRRAQESAESLFPAPEPTLTVRPLRRVELSAIVRLYSEQARGYAGWPQRDEAYWDWLLARGAVDHLYIATRAAESASFAAAIDSVVGYACVRQSHIVELVAAPSEPRAGELLLERICGDARELDGWSVRYDAPANDRLHSVLVRAGGQFHSDASGGVSMVKVFDPLAVLRALGSGLHEQLTAAGVSLPAELGIDLRAPEADARGTKPGIVERFRLHFTRKSATVTTGGPSRHAVSLAQTDFAPLLLRSRSADELIQDGRLLATSATARLLARVLFPGGRWWRPVLDDLMA